MSSTDLLIDDHEFETPIYVAVEKFEEAKIRRDRKGRFAEKAFISLDGREIRVVKRVASDKLVSLDVQAFDEKFQQDHGFYVGPGGSGGMSVHDITTGGRIGKYEKFGKWLADKDSMEAAEVAVDENGRVGFSNGRHRYAYLRDKGLTSMPVAMTPESVENARKHGLLSKVKKAWDESQHQRDADGKFTTFYHGTLKEQLDSITANGLQTSHSGLAWPGLSQPGTIYLGKSKEEAMAWAESTTQRLEWKFHNPTAVVLEVRIPNDVLAKSQVTQGQRADGSPEGNLRVFQDIPPEWIVGVTVGKTHDEVLGIPNRPPPKPMTMAVPPVIPGVTHKAETFYIGLVLDAQSIAAKQEHSYGNTQIQIAPTSKAAASLNLARSVIHDDHCMGDGKDVDPNHVTVRYGLLNDDLDGLRSFIAQQRPFEAELGEIELFPASEHSDGAVPVVARILSPELYAIEAAIGTHADFKDKSFPVYKPHCTLAYCTPEAAPHYAKLFVYGTFVVQSITISHASGVQETIPFGLTQKRQWEESRHRRQPSGSTHGGEFMSTLQGPRDALTALMNEDRDVSIQAGDVRRFMELAAELPEGVEPDLSKLQVEGYEIFGGRGLGIKRDDMPQIPPEHRDQFLRFLEEEHGVKISKELVDPMSLRPTQNGVSARRAGAKLAKYENNPKKKFPAVLVSNADRILDGHHHWGMMAAFALEAPGAVMPITRIHLSTKKTLALMHAYMKRHGLSRATMAGTTAKADPQTGRYVTPFVSFEKQGDELLRMIASLNSSRLATWGFTAEAEVLGMARYKLTAVLDGRTSKFCRLIDGKIFDVPDARRKVIEVLNVQNPDDLRTIQPWPKQDKASMAMYRTMTPDEFVEAGLHIPPYHPHCRTVLRHVQSSAGKATEPPVPTLPEGVETFQPVTAADLRELGIDATPEQVEQWNQHIGMSPVELISKLTGVPPVDVLTKGKGVGTNPVQIDPDGNLGVRARATTPNGVEFKLNAILDPFTGIFYLNEAALEAGTSKAELAFMKNLFTELIDTGLKSSATSVAVGVAGNAVYYARMGFLPDDLEWDGLRIHALKELETGSLQPLMASLSKEDQLLVTHLLQDKSASALSALVELPFTFEGKGIGEWILEDVSGTWGLDLLDPAMVAHAKSYLV